MSGETRKAELGKLLDQKASVLPYDSEQFLAEFEDEIYEHATILAQETARKTVNKYPWICPDDLQQELLVKVAHWASKFDPTKACWCKNLYWRFSFYVKDLLRREDPLGIRFPQREHYPTWFRLAEHSKDVVEAGFVEMSGSDVDAANADKPYFDHTIDAELDAAEQDRWQADIAALNALREANQGSLPSLKDAGQGVCRAARLEYWDRRRNRCKFRLGGNRLSDFLRKAKKGRRFYMLQETQNHITTENQSWDSNRSAQPIIPQAPMDQSPLFAVLDQAGQAGVTSESLANSSGMTKSAVQSAVLRHRRAGLVYVVGHMGKTRRELYALAKFFPDGPPIPQQNHKKASKKSKPKHVTAKQTTPKTVKPESQDIMLVVTALAGVKNKQLKDRLLSVLTESIQA